MNSDSKELLQLFFRELERLSIPYVILHSYEELPDKFGSDVDYAVADWALPKLRGIQIELARKCGWALAQTLQHGVFAFYAVLVNLRNPAETLKLDACSSYARACRFLVSEKILLGNRVTFRGFSIPAPASEFIYELAKMFDAKNKSPAEYLPRLRELWSKDSTTAQAYFNDLFANTGRTLEEWFKSPPDEWRCLRPIMLRRNRFGPVLMLRETVRVLKRLFQPTGLSLAVLGSDGSGKSTLLARLQTLLQPCFRYQRILHFRPGVLRKRQQGAVTDPHRKPPQSIFVSWLKVFYYFADHWAGWFLIVLPGRVRSTLVIFDRHFDDLLLDPKRYRLRGTDSLVRILRNFVPSPDQPFALSAPAEILHQRKPELPLPELERQQRILRDWASNRRYTIIAADQSPADVAEAVGREVIHCLAAREEKRR